MDPSPDESPSPAPPRHGQRLGQALVAGQFGLMGVLAWAAWPALQRGSVPAGALVLALAGLATGLGAVAANRPGNFNIHPRPREGGRLVQHGPYRWIRHPMYSAILALGAAAAWAAGSVLAWAAAATLLTVLTVKSALEERWMMAAHPGYAAYRARTRRFLPGLL